MSAVSLESASIMGCPQIGPSFIVITRIPDKSQTDSAPQWIIAVDARSTWRKSPAFGRGLKCFVRQSKFRRPSAPTGSPICQQRWTRRETSCSNWTSRNCQPALPPISIGESKRRGSRFGRFGSAVPSILADEKRRNGLNSTHGNRNGRPSPPIPLAGSRLHRRRVRGKAQAPAVSSPKSRRTRG